MNYETLAELLDDLMARPDEAFIYNDNTRCAIYAPAYGGFLFLQGDFSGDEEQNNQEIQRIMKETFHARS